MSYAGAFTDKNNTDHPITSTLYGTCATAANEAAKVVVCTDFDTLLTGVTIRVKFSNGNTAANPTININSTGAKSVFRFGSTTPVGAGSWEAGAVVELTYDGTSFFMTNSDNIAAKQNVTDNTLQTTDKTVPGAINELKSGLIGEIFAIGTGATVYRQGAMRILKLYGAESASTGVISELPASDRPLVQVLNPCVYNDGTTKNGYIIIEATGEIKLLDVATDTAVSGGRAFSMISYYIL